MKSFILFLVLLLSLAQSFAQAEFTTKSGKKASYTIEIPDNFIAKEAIGANIDLKFSDENGASIITVVKKLPSGITDGQIIEMSYPSDAAVKNQLEASGFEGVNIIKRGMTIVNGINTYYQYYTANINGTILYYHSLNQFKNEKQIVLTITCEYSKKFSYMPYIFRVVNSLKHK
jgi:hypothetical protein